MENKLGGRFMKWLCRTIICTILPPNNAECANK